MRYVFFLTALTLPVLDIASLIAVGNRIGVWPTVGAVILSVILGSILVRTQGFAIARQARATLQSRRLPAREVFDGVCVLIGGALLMLPGFLSDALGLLLLTPPVRGLLLPVISSLARRFGRLEVFVPGSAGLGPSASAGPVIEGEYYPVNEMPNRIDIKPPKAGRNGGA
ncbi:MAG: FxsA family protein [Rhodospirillales bacterium]|nr:FxsA family protein [Rhodospirillales bacterium]